MLSIFLFYCFLIISFSFIIDVMCTISWWVLRVLNTKDTNMLQHGQTSVCFTNISGRSNTWVHMFYDSIYMKYPEKANLERQIIGCLGERVRKEIHSKWVQKILLGWWKCSKLDLWWWLQNLVNLIKKLNCTLDMGDIYVKYIAIKLWKWKEKRAFVFIFYIYFSSLLFSKFFLSTISASVSDLSLNV